MQRERESEKVDESISPPSPRTVIFGGSVTSPSVRTDEPGPGDGLWTIYPSDPTVAVPGYAGQHLTQTFCMVEALVPLLCLGQTLNYC